MVLARELPPQIVFGILRVGLVWDFTVFSPTILSF